MPLLSLEGMEGKMFAPMAITIAIALAISLILFSLSPVLCSYILKGGSEADTRILKIMRVPYQRFLNWSLIHPKLVLKRAFIALIISIVGFLYLGKSFIPVMQEGSITPVILRAPNILL
jgi:cobalt-zinc-cadmium resistance protein CzcA